MPRTSEFKAMVNKAVQKSGKASKKFSSELKTQVKTMVNKASRGVRKAGSSHGRRVTDRMDVDVHVRRVTDSMDVDVVSHHVSVSSTFIVGGYLF